MPTSFLQSESVCDTKRSIVLRNSFGIFDLNMFYEVTNTAQVRFQENDEQANYICREKSFILLPASIDGQDEQDDAWFTDPDFCKMGNSKIQEKSTQVYIAEEPSQTKIKRHASAPELKYGDAPQNLGSRIIESVYSNAYRLSTTVTIFSNSALENTESLGIEFISQWPLTEGKCISSRSASESSVDVEANFVEDNSKAAGDRLKVIEEYRSEENIEILEVEENENEISSLIKQDGSSISLEEGKCYANLTRSFLLSVTDITRLPYITLQSPEKEHHYLPQFSIKTTSEEVSWGSIFLDTKPRSPSKSPIHRRILSHTEPDELAQSPSKTPILRRILSHELSDVLGTHAEANAQRLVALLPIKRPAMEQESSSGQYLAPVSRSKKSSLSVIPRPPMPPAPPCLLRHQLFDTKQVKFHTTTVLPPPKLLSPKKHSYQHLRKGTTPRSSSVPPRPTKVPPPPQPPDAPPVPYDEKELAMLVLQKTRELKKPPRRAIPSSRSTVSPSSRNI